MLDVLHCHQILAMLSPQASVATDVEAQYLADVAKRRWPVLVFVIAFDVGCYILRFGAKLLASRVMPLPPGPCFTRVLHLGSSPFRPLSPNRPFVRFLACNRMKLSPPDGLSYF